MSETISKHFIAFDNDANLNLFDPETCKSEFETQQEAFDIAVMWKKATGHSISIKCIYTVESEFITL
jgi:hypothetical protein